MKTAKKAVRKAAEARKKPKDKNSAHKAREATIIPPSRDEVDKFAPTKSKPAPEKMPPPFLYKYVPPDTSSVNSIEQIIMNRRIYFPNPVRFNDPFDCQIGLDVSDANTAQRLLHFLREEGVAEKSIAPSDIPKLLDSDKISHIRCAAAISHARQKSVPMLFRGINMGVLCLAERPDSTLMWAHYACSHKGVCFEIAPYRKGVMLYSSIRKVAWHDDPRAFPFEMIQAVSYDTKYMTRPLGDGPDGFDVFFRKSKDWGHEKEWRALMPDASHLSSSSTERLERFQGGNRAYPLGENRVTKVILGCQMSPTYKRYVVYMAQKMGIAIHEAHPKYSEYGIKIVPYEETE